MVNGTALHTIVFDEADNASGLLDRNQHGKNVPSAISDDFDRLVDMMHLYPVIKENILDILSSQDLASQVTGNEVPHCCNGS